MPAILIIATARMMNKWQVYNYIICYRPIAISKS